MAVMRKRILRWYGQCAGVSALIAVALTASLLPGCVEPESDGADGLDAMMMPGLGVEAGGGLIADAGVTADGAAGMLQPMVDASVPRDASAPRDGSVIPADAASPQDGGGVRADTGTGAIVDAAAGGPDPEPGRLAGITAAHNAARARVPTDKPLPPLSWSPDIAKVAQAYAEKLAATCSTTLVHSSEQERMGWGENLAMMSGFGSTPAGSAQQAVDLWESELKCYTFGAFQAGVNATCTNACQMYGGCGHYTQLVWRKTMRLGCGVAECTSGSSKRSFWVCNYDPPGNYLGQLPY
jgi:hypothetical protein